MKGTTRQDYFERMATVLRYIENNIDRTVTLEELAEVACFSPFHFHRIFRSWVGESLAGYLRRLRVEKAASDLRYSDKRVFDIALDAGFSSPESFARAFKKRFDLSPQQFRDAHAVIPVVSEMALDTVQHHLFYMKGCSMITVNIEKRDAVQVAAVRHVGPYENVGTAWETLCKWAGPKGLLNETTEFVGLSWDDPDISDAEKIRYDATVNVPTGVKTEGDVVLQEIVGGEYVVILHEGALENLNQTYKRLFTEWLPGSGREIRNAPSLEKYLNDPDRTPPEEIRVEIAVPLV